MDLRYALLHGDCLTKLRELPDDSVDSVVTDPPAGISFMNKSWDDDKGGRDQWIKWMSEVMAECLRVLKPGGHALVWAIPRTSHWTATAVENAGFEVRDVVTHLFGSGFPKSLDISKAIDKEAGAKREVIGLHSQPASSLGNGLNMDGGKAHETVAITTPATDAAKQWQGFGTALKPAAEFWILARKPLSEKTVAKNVLKHGTGGLNIDASRIGTGGHHGGSTPAGKSNSYGEGKSFSAEQYTPQPNKVYTQGRFPANLVLSGDAPEMLDEQSGILKTGGNPRKTKQASTGLYGMGLNIPDGPDFSGSVGGASRFFYCAKVSPSERGEDNKHPTVKPIKLMSYLIKLITPPGGIVLDPFMGSGSTGVAAQKEGFDFIGIEQEEEYYNIASKRLAGIA